MTPAPSSAPRRPLLVELAGPPGAGKSTVFEGLLARDERIEARPSVRRSSSAALMAGSALPVLMMLLRHRALRGSLGHDLRALAYMWALPRILKKRPANRIVVFDQGPIYFLTRPKILDERLRGWWLPTLEAWSSRLDVVVWLDAPDDVLLERIGARSKPHRVKGRPHDFGLQFLARSRALYDVAISHLHAHGSGPMILRVDTCRRSPDQAADEILAALTRVRPHLARRTAAARL